MKEKINWDSIDTKELAGLLFQHFKEDGIEVILVGGSCVTIYSDNKHISKDLDYVTHIEFRKIKSSLERIGFMEKNGQFKHLQCPFLIDFVTQPVAVGKEIIKNFEEMPTKYGIFKLLSATDCVKDRLAGFFHWNDRQGLEQAVNVSFDNEVDIKVIKQWSKNEGFKEKFLIFEKALKMKKNS